MISTLKRMLARTDAITTFDAPTPAPVDPLAHPEEYLRGVSFVRDQIVAATQSMIDATRPSWRPFCSDLTGHTYEVIELVRVRALRDVEKMRAIDVHAAQVAGAEAALGLIADALSDGIENASRGRYDLVSNTSILIDDLNNLVPDASIGSRS